MPVNSFKNIAEYAVSLCWMYRGLCGMRVIYTPLARGVNYFFDDVRSRWNDEVLDFLEDDHVCALAIIRELCLMKERSI